MSADRPVVIWRSCLLPGSETFVRHQAGALTRWRPTFLGAVKVSSPLADDADIIAYRGGSRFLWLRLTGSSRRLRRLLAEAAPALVHAHLAGDGWLISGAADRLGIPLVITLHGRDVTVQPEAPGIRGTRYRRNLRTAFDRAALILAVSEPIRQRAIALGADPAKVRVHHTGVAIPPALSAATPEWDVAFVGRFVPKKGIDDLIEALASLPAPRPRALFIGAGPLEPAMRERAASLGLDATFLGAQEPAAVRHHLSRSRIFAAPSKTAPDGDAEGLPTTILEAASLGLPTVSTYHSGIPEAVVHGETGLLCAEGDSCALAENLRRLLTDEPLRERLGRQARRQVAAHFDLTTQTQLLERLYDAVAAGDRERLRLIGSADAHGES
jgi:colanic acid/amylovoran biosynthesis glycosyltransferase